jgi:polar amino acid transport system permease protein
MNNLSWLIGWVEWVPELLPGLGVSFLLTLVSCGFGYPLGFLLALMTGATNRGVKWAAIVAVEVGRGIPVLVLLFLIYQGLPQAGITLPAEPAAVIAFTWSAAAYSAEIIRASIAAVPRGQFEGAFAVSLSQVDMYRFVILPQAARISVPPLVNLTIIMFHCTALASVITVSEMMHAAYFSGSVNFQYMSVYTAAAVLYAIIAIPGALLAGHMEKRLGVPVSIPRTNFLRRSRRTPAI